MKRWLKLGILCALIAIIVMPMTAQAAESVWARSAKECLHSPQVKLNQELRKLWSDHVIWTRNFIVSDLADLEDKEKTLGRLLKNQQDIGNAIKPFYGEDAGNKLAGLLREHILIAGKVIDAAKSGNQGDLEKYNKEWFQNADSIAKFLSSINSNWSEKELRNILHTHLKLVTEDVVARLGKNWDADIVAFDTNLNHMLMLADVMSEGIIKQFPEQFK
ncbi:glycosyltransferase [Paenibacillaceae bacterium]|nr:glycosyltransferase [Paenibacillaceae bacterium]